MAYKPPEDVGANLMPWTELHRAARDGDRRGLRKLLRTGERQVDEVFAENDQTALTLAATQGKSGAVQDLLNFQADVNHKVSNGQTALHYAVSHGQVDCVRELVLANADVKLKNNRGKSPLDLAWSKEVLEILNGEELSGKSTY
eukprot:TRINITY_DN94923_c0_g1_i1.p1 TRINITY_DN94923_c0_g1~~TRINITY_DN94923_c0_g1_i1.p1  ORF type:complete len:144 (-),score=30.45 TRINITY_DN94923_c0_g1_i1:65-496(-)